MAVMLQYRLWAGEGSIGQIVSLKEKISHQVALNQQLSDRNAAIIADVIDLQSGSDSIEEYARNQLGMIKPGETFFLVVED